VYGAREQGQWWVRAGEAKRPLKKRPVAGLGPDTDGAEAGDTFSVMVTGNKTVDIAM
jgi:hypothetical protein